MSNVAQALLKRIAFLSDEEFEELLENLISEGKTAEEITETIDQAIEESFAD